MSHNPLKKNEKKKLFQTDSNKSGLFCDDLVSSNETITKVYSKQHKKNVVVIDNS